jgi:hypothetical protein
LWYGGLISDVIVKPPPQISWSSIHIAYSSSHRTFTEVGLFYDTSIQPRKLDMQHPIAVIIAILGLKISINASTLPKRDQYYGVSRL